MRETGQTVNIIIHQKSKLSADRHLNRIPYHALVEYMPGGEEFIIKDGAHKGKIYTPKTGDIIANIDKSTDLINPILKNLETETIYRNNPPKKSGLILKISGTKP